MFHLAALGGIEWIAIVSLLVLLFGARKLPELARSMGTSITEFKKGLKSDGDSERLAAGHKNEDEPS